MSQTKSSTIIRVSSYLKHRRRLVNNNKMSGKHGGGAFSVSGAISKKAKLDAVANSSLGDRHHAAAHQHHNMNPFMSRPAIPEETLKLFLVQSRTQARNLAKKNGMTFPVTKHFCEIEARIGIIKNPHGRHDKRVLPSGPKTLTNKNGQQRIINAFVCNDTSQPSNNNRTAFVGGITRTDFTRWTAGGLSEPSPMSHAFGVKTKAATSGSGSEASQIKKELMETERVETVYGGYDGHSRVCFPGEHRPYSSSESGGVVGTMETKEKLLCLDVALPSAKYDLRVTLATEDTTDGAVRDVPAGWSTRRVKRRRSYKRKDHKFAWQLDVTEVSNERQQRNGGYDDDDREEEEQQVSYELEIELHSKTTLDLVNCDDGKALNFCKSLASQLWWMLGQINPISEVLEVESYLKPHPSDRDTTLALAQCLALRKFMNDQQWTSVIPYHSSSPPQLPHKRNFIGCMPVNFSRHNIEQVQRSTDGYYLSEKTDGVRYLLVFTGNTAVLIDRAMKGNQPCKQNQQQQSLSHEEPFAPILGQIQPGTVLDGEVVIHRHYRRPIFIVFDVLCCGEQPVLHKPFEERLKHLRQATFRTANANRDMFSPSDVKNPHVTLPLVRKNFVRRTELDKLLFHVVEEKGSRSYRNGDLHNHLTDGIIFQPNRPYQCGTDTHLLKWKYLDTVTIDVELLEPKYNHRTQREDTFRVGVMGDENSMVDMTRFVHLPTSELLRLEADREETGAKVAEVGFDPATGEWYYLTMRPDKTHSNHISTVLGTLLELAESLNTDELRYRMNVPGGVRDTYRKEFKGMLKQLLSHQRQMINRK